MYKSINTLEEKLAGVAEIIEEERALQLIEGLHYVRVRGDKVFT